MGDGTRPRPFFSAEFKPEAVRRMEERRAADVTRTQIRRGLDVRSEMLREWKRVADGSAGRTPADVFPGHGRQPGEEHEVRRLKRELARAQQEVTFRGGVAVDVARGSR